MKSSLLPEPLDFSEYKDLESQEEYAYRYFLSNIKNEGKREKLNEKKIIINTNRQYLEAKEEAFEHLTGFNQTNSYSHSPCLNLDIEMLCSIKCEVEKVPPNQRILCLYRARFLPWFNSIIKLASNNDKHIKKWEVKKAKDTRLLIRFQEGNADYLIVLRKLKTDYKLVTAYPLFTKGDRAKCDREYSASKK